MLRLSFQNIELFIDPIKEIKLKNTNYNIKYHSKMLQDIKFTHWACSVVEQPWIHATLVEFVPGKKDALVK